jgi:hypothetical protein
MRSVAHNHFFQGGAETEDEEAEVEEAMPTQLNCPTVPSVQSQEEDPLFAEMA